MSRYIDADKLCEKADEILKVAKKEHRSRVIDFMALLMVPTIVSQPTIDVAPVVHARWEWVTKNIYYCTECGRETSVEEYMEKPTWNYCPHCGAIMDADEEEE